MRILTRSGLGFGRLCGVLAATAILAAAESPARAATLLPAVQQALATATFEVVLAKPVDDPLTYEKPLPLELLPFRERTDKYRSIGTAFAIGPNRYVSAAHVLDAGRGSQYGPLALRNAAGKTYPVAEILKYSNAQDYVIFSVRNGPSVVPLATRQHPTLNQPVFAVGNAYGEGVVIRDGLYTSDSPEEVDGRWSWLRFSAAASPGNSGGPLVDRNGKVIGIVLKKSPNENLNYALPIDLALDGPDDAGVFEFRSTYRLGATKATDTWKFDERIPLPRPIEGFYKSQLMLLSAQLKKARAEFLERHGANIFPFGPQAAELLHTTFAAAFPRVIAESDSGVWGASDDKAKSVQLDHNGYLQLVTWAGVGTLGLAKLTVPDDVEPLKLLDDSKQFMDLLLKAIPLHRPVGSDAVRVTSLGAAREEDWIADPYGRRWQVRSWSIPFSDAIMLTIDLPTPDGGAMIVAEVPTASLEMIRDEFEQMSRFIYVSFDGTLKQWKDYLSRPDVHPAIMSSVALQFDYGRGFRLKSPRFQLLLPAALQRVDADSILHLNFSYFLDGTRPVWDIGGVFLADDKQEKHWINVWRHPKPPPSLPDRFGTQWRNMATAGPPYDGTARGANGRTEIQALANAKEVSAGASSVAYSITVSIEGAQTGSHMKSQLDTLRRGFTVSER